MDALVYDMLPKAKREPDVSFSLPGEPRGKGRPRSRIATAKSGQQFVSVYTDASTRSYEAMLRYAAREAMGNRVPLDCALDVLVTAFFAVPESWSGKQRSLAFQGGRRPTTRPDADNINKAILDACNKIVWVDDSRVVRLVTEKHYSKQPRIQIDVWRTSLPGLFA